MPGRTASRWLRITSIPARSGSRGRQAGLSARPFRGPSDAVGIETGVFDPETQAHGSSPQAAKSGFFPADRMLQAVAVQRDTLLPGATGDGAPSFVEHLHGNPAEIGLGIEPQRAAFPEERPGGHLAAVITS